MCLELDALSVAGYASLEDDVFGATRSQVVMCGRRARQRQRPPPARL
jgi:hypothetical protein